MDSSRILFTLMLAYILNGPTIEGKHFMRCELVRELRRLKITNTFLSNWICLIEHESERKTDKIVEKRNGSKNYGLFQINSKEYCRPGRRGGLCNKNCLDFTDDNIADDVECANLIFDREGFKHWNGWSSYCQNGNVPNLGVVCKSS